MPSDEIIKKALEQIRKRPANHDYFFSKLDSADWIEPLDRAELFSTPPQAIREGEKISFPFWPESQYLQRMASIAPEQVAAVIMRMLETDNVRVHEDLAQAASKLPAFLAARWAQKEAVWVEKQEYLYFSLPEALGNLIAHLAVSGELQATLALAKAVFRIRIGRDNSRQAYAKFDKWEYEELLKKYYPEVIRHTDGAGIALLCDLLDAALIEESDSEEDCSWIWRPAIEPHSQNHRHGELRNALIDSIRDSSELLIQIGTGLSEIIRTFLDRKRLVFSRIAIHLAAEHSQYLEAKEIACNREFFFNICTRHEYSRLLSKVFSQLDHDEKHLILSWIEEGPPIEGENKEEDPELRRKWKATWQAQRLYGLRGQLPEEWEQRYSVILSEFGEPESPDFVFYTTSWTGPTSPIEVHELEAMSAEEIASFLKSWQPDHGLHTPTPEGLGRILQSVVVKSPCKFVTGLKSFCEVDSTYSRALVQGLNEAIKSGQTIEWALVVDYLSWIIAQPRDMVRESSSRLDHDPHWGWARKAAASLLSIGFEKNSIDFILRERVWRVVATIADDSDPTPEDDEKSTMDPATRSINTTRGEALHAVVRYAFWVRRAICGEEMGSARSFDMSLIPEVKECLERHLNPSSDPSPAIRAVYGQWFPWLLSLDNTWAKANIDSMFPAENAVLRDAAWETYLAFCPVFNEPFRVLRRQYSAGVDRLRTYSDAKTSWRGRPSERLGEHLMVSVGRGLISWADEDDIVRRFFDSASVPDASNAVEFIGRSLRNDSNSIPIEVVDRFRCLWDELVSHILSRSAERMQLLKPFGWWFVSGRFEIHWAFTQLMRVIETTGSVEPEHMVMERLEDLANTYPGKSLEVLKAISRREERGWGLLGWKDSAQKVLQAALCSDADTAHEAKTLIHLLGARGYFQFRDLL